MPFLGTLFLVVFLSLNNNKQYTKIKFLIWSTPLSSLGTYLAISTGAGFAISYIITTNLANFNQTKKIDKLEYKVDNQNTEYEETTNKFTYDNTLIEREVNEPSPTVKASFRVIGKIERKQGLETQNESDEFERSNFNKDFDNQYYKEEIKYVNDKDVNRSINDWNDDTYINW